MATQELRAQTFLNLGFEKPGAEGPARPWGWYIEREGPGTIAMDSTRVREGRYSIRFCNPRAAADSLTVISYSIEPWAFSGHRVRLEGWFFAEQADTDVRLMLTYSIKDKEKTDTMRIMTKARAWQHMAMQLVLPRNADGLALKLSVSGRGCTWFDDLSISVDGKKMKQAAAGPPFSAAQHAWLAGHVHPFASIDAEKAADPVSADLDFFLSQVKDAKIIALGESTHGTGDFFRLKHRILSYAVKKLGIRLFAIEDNQVVVERVNRYVMGGPGNARSSMHGMLTPWQTKEVEAMIQWIRDYNDLHPADKVRFGGFDIQNVQSPADSLFAMLNRTDKPLRDTAGKILGAMLKQPLQHFFATEQQKEQWRADGETVFRLVKNYAAQSPAQGVGKEADRMVQYANLIRQYAHNLWIGHLPLYRDTAMAENIGWLLERTINQKMLVWAHDYHISRGDHPIAEQNIYNGISMGSHLSKKYGSEYKAFGLETYTGTYWAQLGYSNFHHVAFPLTVAPAGTLDHALHMLAAKKQSPFLFLDLSDGRKQPWLAKPLPARFANHVAIEDQYWSKYAVSYQFDGIFFIDQTTAAKSYAVD